MSAFCGTGFLPVSFLRRGVRTPVGNLCHVACALAIILSVVGCRAGSSSATTRPTTQRSLSLQEIIKGFEIDVHICGYSSVMGYHIHP